MQHKKHKVLAILSFVVISMLSFSFSVFADSGPKPDVTIRVINPPAEEYYLDLLQQDHGVEDSDGFQNINEAERAKLDKNMLALLSSYKKDGWYPALSGRTGFPLLGGNLAGEKEGAATIHRFYYWGVPSEFRIIIVTKSGKVTVTDVCDTTALICKITYDYKTGKITIPPVKQAYFSQFLVTCIPTLLLEGLILLLFGFKLKENYKMFLVANISTQILLTIVTGIAFSKDYSLVSMVEIAAELFIMGLETILYIRFLKGQNLMRRIAYGITANLVSWLVSYNIINLLFERVFISN